MSGLGLVPNEIVGWRIKPDWYNFTVVLVKRHGPSSKKAGQEYEEPLAYCSTLENAVRRIISQEIRAEGERLQALDALEGSVASAQAMLTAIESAQKAAFAAVADLEARLKAAGLDSPKKLTHFLGGTAPGDDGETDAE